MNAKINALALGATAMLTVGLGATAATPAEAAAINCGQPYYSSDREGVVHSCDGTGLIQYTIDCTLPPDVQFTYRWENGRWKEGESRFFPYTCDGRGEWAVSYEIVE